MKSLLLLLSLGFTITLQAQLCEETIFESCDQCYINKIVTVDFDFDGDEDLFLGSGYKDNFVWFENSPMAVTIQLKVFLQGSMEWQIL